MSHILNIDTSIETASVSIAADGIITASMSNTIQKEHASFLHVAIQELFASTNMQIKDIDAVAVTEGPGSYTGLRVGMASAKGLCYALNKPFITIGTLNALAYAAMTQQPAIALYCPMIDARRMEVYTALFDVNMTAIMPASAMVLNQDCFKNELADNKIIFAGSGAQKWSNTCLSSNAFFLDNIDIAISLASLSYQKFAINDIANLSYSEPLYVKDFYTS